MFELLTGQIIKELFVFQAVRHENKAGEIVQFVACSVVLCFAQHYANLGEFGRIFELVDSAFGLVLVHSFELL